MARVKRGVTTHARHKKVTKLPKAIMVPEKTFLLLPHKLLKKLVNMRTETVEIRKECLEVFGFKELTLVLDYMV